MQEMAKEFLRRYQVAEQQIQASMRAIDDLREKATRITGYLSPDKVWSGNKESDRVGEGATMIAYTEDRLRESVEKCRGILEEITDVIMRVSDARLQTVLVNRYITGLAWEEIAQRMRYEVRQIYRLHSAALQAVVILLTDQGANHGRKEA